MYFRRQKLCVKQFTKISYGIDQREFVDCVIMKRPIFTEMVKYFRFKSLRNFNGGIYISFSHFRRYKMVFNAVLITFGVLNRVFYVYPK